MNTRHAAFLTLFLLPIGCASPHTQSDSSPVQLRTATEYNTDGTIKQTSTFTLDDQLFEKTTYRYNERGSLVEQKTTTFETDGTTTEAEIWYSQESAYSTKTVRRYGVDGKFLSEKTYGSKHGTFPTTSK